MINGSLSLLLQATNGVPQGSILGPILYTLFTNELPEVIHPDDCISRNNCWPPYILSCNFCGNICCFADDTTYSYSDTDLESLSSQISSNFKKISDFLVSNRLKLNEDKTHLLTLSRRMRKNTNSELVLDTPSSQIMSSQSEKLLGCIVHNNLKWADHILHGDGSLVRALSGRINALKLISKVASFKVRKSVAEGKFMSKLIYLIEIWGGCEKYLLRSLQLLQNRVVRIVTNQGSRKPTIDLFTHCGWLSVRQLAVYHAVIMLHKAKVSGLPKYLNNMFLFDQQPRRLTRLADLNLVRSQKSQFPRYELTKTGFKWRSIQHYNCLPLKIRCIDDMNKFKVATRQWVKENIPFA